MLDISLPISDLVNVDNGSTTTFIRGVHILIKLKGSQEAPLFQCSTLLGQRRDATMTSQNLFLFDPD